MPHLETPKSLKRSKLSSVLFVEPASTKVQPEAQEEDHVPLVLLAQLNRLNCTVPGRCHIAQQLNAQRIVEPFLQTLGMLGDSIIGYV